jgi:hypothetical protein
VNSNATPEPDLSRLRAGERPSHGDATWRAEWRAAITLALLADLQPGDHALALWLLEQEIAAGAQSSTGPMSNLRKAETGVGTENAG